MGTQPSASRRAKGPRPKHVPVRMCIICRQHSAKRALTRVVRTPEQAVHVDPTGKANGRGAYLCGGRSCWEKALAGGALSRALQVTIKQDDLAELKRYAATLPLSDADASAVNDEGVNHE